MGAIVVVKLMLMMIASLTQTLVHAQENATNLNQCIIDTRVSTLRCLLIPFDAILEALNSWDLTSITRLEINKAAIRKIDRLRSTELEKDQLQFSEISLVNR